MGGTRHLKDCQQHVLSVDLDNSFALIDSLAASLYAVGTSFALMQVELFLLAGR